MPVYFPPLPGTANDASTVIAGQVFGPRTDFSPLKSPKLKEFLGFSTSGGNVDDANNILATQVYGP